MRRVFGSALCLWLGKRSYSIYLTHWPIMVLWPMATDGNLSAFEGSIAILASIVTGMLLHTLIEKRFRIDNQASEKRINVGVIGTLAACLIISITSAHVWASRGASNISANTNEGLQFNLDSMRKGRGKMFAQYNMCNVSKDIPVDRFNKKVCTEKHPTKPTVLVLGDSFGTEARAILAAAYPEIHFAQITVDGCRLSVRDRIRNDGRLWCRKFIELGLETANNGRYDGLVFSANWRKDQLQDMNELVAWANSIEMEPVVLLNRLRFTERVREFTAGSPNVEVATQLANDRLNPHYKAKQETFAQQLKGKFTVVDVYPLQCNRKPCPIFTADGQLMYLDALHLTVPGINHLALQFANTHPQLFD